MDVATIGFTNKSAEKFFGLLRQAEVRALLDVRVNNLELRDLAPEKQMLKRYQRKELNWDSYAAEYIELLAKRRVERNLDVALFDRAWLLCSEDSPQHCHRRLIAEYLKELWGDVEIHHLDAPRRGARLISTDS